QEVIEADASEIGGPKGDIGIIIRYDDRITARYMGIDANQIGIGRCGNVDDVHCRPRSYEHLVFVWKDRFDVPVQLKAVDRNRIGGILDVNRLEEAVVQVKELPGVDCHSSQRAAKTGARASPRCYGSRRVETLSHFI